VSARVKLDEIDVRILKTLLKDPRTSFAEIAEQCGMSINAIRMRFKRLKQVGVIQGAIMQVNPRSLGYCCIAYLMIRADTNKEESVLEFLEKTPNVIQSFQQMGRTNIHCLAALESFDELAHTIEYVWEHPCIMMVEAIIWVDIVRMDHPENLVIEPFDGLSHTTNLSPKDENPKPTITPSPDAYELTKENNCRKCYELDKIDQIIIKILSENARMSFRKIAQKLDVSTQSVIRRYKRLRKNISPYSSITLNLKKLGYIGTALFLIKITHQKKSSKVVDEILSVPNVITAIRTFGNFDIFVAVPFSSYEQLFKLNQSISKISGVMQIELFWGKPFVKWPLNLFSKLLQK
jgi:Lrp/AsnC family transcriptional regulator for asnA, asnC and gidA